MKPVRLFNRFGAAVAAGLVALGVIVGSATAASAGSGELSDAGGGSGELSRAIADETAGGSGELS